MSLSPDFWFAVSSILSLAKAEHRVVQSEGFSNLCAGSVFSSSSGRGRLSVLIIRTRLPNSSSGHGSSFIIRGCANVSVSFIPVRGSIGHVVEGSQSLSVFEHFFQNVRRVTFSTCQERLLGPFGSSSESFKEKGMTIHAHGDTVRR